MAPEAVKQARATLTYTNSTKIRTAAIVTGVLTTGTSMILLTIVGIAPLQPFLLGILPNAATGSLTTWGIIARARHTGLWDS